MMTLISRAVRPLLVIAISSGCARGLHGPSLDTPTSPAPRQIDELSIAERRAILDRAQVWRPTSTRSLNLLRGPAGAGALAYNAPVICTYSHPKEPLTGDTPKFECDLKPKDRVKVKYGEDNGEVYAEVAATRLFWALGFPVDRMYPVTVTCVNCPADPHRASAIDWRPAAPDQAATRQIEPATIERKFDSKAVEVPGYKGWSWRELEDVADNKVGAPRAHIDALKLLAAFIQHVDSKPDNQALVCPENAIGKDRRGNATCSRPLLVVKDVGSSFADAKKLSFPKMKLESWKEVRIWKDEKTCQADLTSSLVGTLEHPKISEGGRKFLADRLNLLSDKQLNDLFTVSRVERRSESMDGRPVKVADWVRVFKDKRAQIVNHRCVDIP